MTDEQRIKITALSIPVVLLLRQRKVISSRLLSDSIRVSEACTILWFKPRRFLNWNHYIMVV